MNTNKNDFMASTATQNASFAPISFAKDASNPFMAQMSSNPFTVNLKPRDFIPTVEKTGFPTTFNNAYTSSTNSGYTSEESMPLAKDSHSDKESDEKYKTEMCKNWIETKSCRYGKKCQFAHGYEELMAHKSDNKLRTKNCRTFYKTKICNYGSRCMFRHEHRHYN